MIGGSFVVFAMRGEKNFGIDFRGGDLLVIDSKATCDRRSRLARRSKESGWATSLSSLSAKECGTAFRFEARREHPPPSSPSSKKPFPIAASPAVAQENVGPQIGLEFAKRAALALGLGMIGILIYVTLRFEFSFALGGCRGPSPRCDHYLGGVFAYRRRTFARHGRSHPHHRWLLDQ